MTVRYSRQWGRTELGRALIAVFGWPNVVPRVGGLFPGITTPIPGGSPVGLPVAVESAARSFLARYDTLYLQWSGGVDSTLVAAALLHYRKKQRLILTTSDQSARDAPAGLLELLLERGVEAEPFDIDRMKAITQAGGMVVTGHHADSIMLGELADAKKLHDDIWHMTPLEMIQVNAECEVTKARILLRQLEPVIGLMPFERTAANIAWWLDFTCCWDPDEMQPYLQQGLTPGDIGYEAFFKSSLFQRWAMQDVRNKTGRTETTKKEQYVELVERFLGSRFTFVKNIIDEQLCLPDSPIHSDQVLLIDEQYHITYVS